MKKILSIMLCVMMMASMVVGCTQQAPKTPSTPPVEPSQQPATTPEITPAPTKETKPLAGTSIILSTTTSTQDSGLLDYLMPIFTEETGVEVKVISVGTGKAIQMGKDGEADVLLVHSTPDEVAFVEKGHGLARHDVMYNDFILVGHPNDVAKVKTEGKNSIAESLKLISDAKSTFVSRGDDSGTHKKELALWKEAAIEPVGDWYVEAGQGMGDVLTMANEKEGYTIADRATYLSMKDKLDLEIVTENDTNLFNQYGVLLVDPKKNDKINAEGAEAFQTWILSEKTQKLISEFGVDKYGQSLFVPNAAK